jgi:hypothetical protein
MVEGQPRRGLTQNIPKHRIGILEKLAGGNANSFDSRGPKPSVAIVIAMRPVAVGMRLAIHLDRQPCIAAEEIQHIGSGRMLASELEAGRTLTKPMPQDDFWKRHLTP